MAFRKGALFYEFTRTQSWRNGAKEHPKWRGTDINTLKDIAAALSRPAPSAISFPADPRFLTSLYYGEYEADVFKPDKRLTPFNQTVQQKEKALLPLLSSEASIAFEQYQTAVQCRNSAVLEQAYASGYRTAVQMFAAGLGPQPPIPEHGEDSNG